MTAMDIIQEIVSDEDRFIPALIAVAVVSSVFIRSVTSVFVGISRERTKREIAAYVAEGTIKPDEAVRLLNAGRPASEQRERTVA